MMDSPVSDLLASARVLHRRRAAEMRVSQSEKEALVEYLIDHNLMLSHYAGAERNHLREELMRSKMMLYGVNVLSPAEISDATE